MDRSFECWWVRPGAATVVEVRARDRLTVIDPDGGQPAELTALASRCSHAPPSSSSSGCLRRSLIVAAYPGGAGRSCAARWVPYGGRRSVYELPFVDGGTTRAFAAGAAPELNAPRDLNSGFILGTAAAIAWGVADVCVTYYSRRIGFLRALLVIHGLSLIPLAALGIALGAPEGASWTVWAAAAALGPVAVVAYTGFYRALELGPIAIVSPIVSAFGAVVVLLALLVLGERLTALQALGCALVLGFMMLAATERAASQRLGGAGIGLSLIACLGFGVYLFLQGQLADELGWLFPILVSRVVAVAIIAALVAARPKPEPMRLRAAGILGCAATGALEASAYLFFNRGSEIGEVAITGAATSAYPILPIIVGLLVLRERMAWHQVVGVAGVLVGMVVLSLG